MIKIYKDSELLSIGAADLFADCAFRAIDKKGSFSVALSGGRTPRRMYELLASAPYSDQINWEKTDIFWGDERCVSLCDDRSNCRMAFDNLLDCVPIPRENIHPILCEENSLRGAEEYEQLLMEYFKGQPPRFDLIFLGLGENGHTASLFPGTELLHENGKLTGSLHVQEEEYDRVSLTARAINEAAVIAFLVSGVSKASILKKTLEGPKGGDCVPAQLISPVDGDLLWLVDLDASSLLTNTVTD